MAINNESYCVILSAPVHQFIVKATIGRAFFQRRTTSIAQRRVSFETLQCHSNGIKYNVLFYTYDSFIVMIQML